MAFLTFIVIVAKLKEIETKNICHAYYGGLKHCTMKQHHKVIGIQLKITIYYKKFHIHQFCF